MDYSLCPPRERVLEALAEFSRLTTPIAEIQKTEEELRYTVVAAYLALQTCKSERVLNPESSHPMQSCLVRALTVHLTEEFQFTIVNNAADTYAPLVNQMEFLKTSAAMPVWNSLDDENKKEVWRILHEIELIREKHSLVEISRMKKELLNAITKIKSIQDPWAPFRSDPKSYTVHLMQILSAAGVAYVHQSEKLSVRNVMEGSEGLESFPQTIPRPSWRVVPEQYAVKTLDQTFLRSKSGHLLKVPELIAFFHAGEFEAAQSVQVAFVGEYGVYVGSLSRDYRDPCSGEIPTIRIAIEVRVRNELSHMPPASNTEDASLVFVPNQQDTVYTISFINLPRDLRSTCNSEEKKIAVDQGLALLRASKNMDAYPDRLSESWIERKEKGAFFSDGFELIPKMLLFGGVADNWGYIAEKKAICAVVPEQLFDGSLVIPRWISPVFRVGTNYRNNVWKTCFIHCEGTMYPTQLFVKSDSSDPVLYLPINLQKEIYRRLEKCSSLHETLLLLFEDVYYDIYLLHFSSTKESLNSIRNRNSSWNLKTHPNRIRRDSVWIDSDSYFGSRIYYSMNEHVEICQAISNELIEAYPRVSKQLLSMFKDTLTDESYEELKEALVPYQYMYKQQMLDQFIEKHSSRSASTQKKKNTDRQKVVLDWDQVQTASDDLNTTAELLGATYDDDDEVPETSSLTSRFEASGSIPVVALADGDDAWKPFADALTPEQVGFMRAMLFGVGNTAELKRLAKQEGKLLDTYIDELNELAVDTFGDVLIDDGAIISEYRDDLSRVLRNR